MFAGVSNYSTGIGVEVTLLNPALDLYTFTFSGTATGTINVTCDDFASVLQDPNTITQLCNGNFAYLSQLVTIEFSNDFFLPSGASIDLSISMNKLDSAACGTGSKTPGARIRITG